MAVTLRIGLLAACPSPQIEASRITSDKSLSNGTSQLPSAISVTAFSVPARQGVHLPAALVLEEPHQVERYIPHVVLVGEDDDRMAADKTAVFLKLSEVERQIGHGSRKNAAGGTMSR